MKPKIGDLVLIEWYDAFGMPGWRDVDEIRADTKRAEIITVGWLVDVSKDYYVVTIQVQRESHGVGSTASIPISCTDRIVSLGSKYRHLELLP